MAITMLCDRHQISATIFQCRIHFTECYSATFLSQTPIFDWCVVKRGSTSKHHKDT